MENPILFLSFLVFSIWLAVAVLIILKISFSKEPDRELGKWTQISIFLAALLPLCIASYWIVGHIDPDTDPINLTTNKSKYKVEIFDYKANEYIIPLKHEEELNRILDTLNLVGESSNQEDIEIQLTGWAHSPDPNFKKPIKIVHDIEEVKNFELINYKKKHATKNRKETYIKGKKINDNIDLATVRALFVREYIKGQLEWEIKNEQFKIYHSVEKHPTRRNSKYRAVLAKVIIPNKYQ